MLGITGGIRSGGRQPCDVGGQQIETVFCVANVVFAADLKRSHERRALQVLWVRAALCCTEYAPAALERCGLNTLSTQYPTERIVSILRRQLLPLRSITIITAQIPFHPTRERPSLFPHYFSP